MAQVSVTHSGSGAAANPDQVKCRADEWLTWTVPANAKLTIRFPTAKGHPFRTNPPYVSTTAGGQIRVQVVHAPAVGTYPYTITLEASGKTVDLDPAVIIDNTEAMKCDEGEETVLVNAASKEADHLLQQALERLTAAVGNPDASKFFPRGIDSISIEVQVASVRVAMTISGPKPSGT